MPLTSKISPEKSYVRTVRKLIANLLSGSKFQQSLFGQAQQFYELDQSWQAEISELQQQLEQSQAQLRLATRKTEAALTLDTQQKRQVLQKAELAYENRQQQRYNQLHLLCQQILELTEGASRSETISRSSRLLGTLQLLAPSEGEQLSAVHLKYKPFYKAVLSLRLLDHLLERQLITNSYILKKHREQQQPQPTTQGLEYRPFRDDVQIPLLMAVLLQDVGHYHPQAQVMLQGEQQSDRWREFDAEERSQFLSISQAATLRFVSDGIGVSRYRGNSRTERDEFVKKESEKQAFCQTLLKMSSQPGLGIGNLLRLPQVYASAVLPGRARFVYQTLPKVALILKNGARAGHYDERMVDQLLTITGVFPQGYGVVYIPKEKQGFAGERYEFAIVNSLYPPSPEVPLCRAVSRNLHYRANGLNLSVSVEHNLYFKPARQKLTVMPDQRLQEILSKLTAGFEPGKLRNLLPRYWHPDEFFADPKHQNLWNKTELLDN